MGGLPSLGIVRVEAIHYYVRDLERSRRFYADRLGFAETGSSGIDLIESGRQQSIVFEAGGCRVVCSSPRGAGGRANRYLQKHPDGVGSIVFEVSDIDRALALFEEQGGTPVHDIRTTTHAAGTFKTFVAVTPLGDTTLRFVERIGAFPLYPGFDLHEAREGSNGFGFSAFDHITCNFETMAPALFWMEHVLGFERFWQVAFHTDDVARSVERHGSGLRSVVMWDPRSGVKFANNEPHRPNFGSSQINVFHEQHRGDGVQHVALAVADIAAAVRGLRARGVEFMPTPDAYYEALPARLEALGIKSMAPNVEELRELGILVDGDGAGKHLLQIFLKDSANLYGSAEAGPFFYEIIQRHGDDGFGQGNFRALFESIEREQTAMGKR